VTLPETVPFLGFGWGDLLFMVFGAVMVVGGLAVVLQKDIIRSGLAMIICFAALAGVYVIAGTPVVAAAQVLVYIGAISVLVLFAIMLTQTKNAPTRLVFQTQAWAAAVAAGVIAIIVTSTALSTVWPASPVRLWTVTSDVAHALFRDFVLPFEVVSVLLTAAVVGAVLLARRETTKREEDR